MKQSPGVCNCHSKPQARTNRGLWLTCGCCDHTRLREPLLGRASPSTSQVGRAPRRVDVPRMSLRETPALGAWASANLASYWLIPWGPNTSGRKPTKFMQKQRGRRKVLCPALACLLQVCMVSRPDHKQRGGSIPEKASPFLGAYLQPIHPCPLPPLPDSIRLGDSACVCQPSPKTHTPWRAAAAPVLKEGTPGTIQS